MPNDALFCNAVDEQAGREPCVSDGAIARRIGLSMKHLNRAGTAHSRPSEAGIRGISVELCVVQVNCCLLSFYQFFFYSGIATLKSVSDLRSWLVFQ